MERPPRRHCVGVSSRDRNVCREEAVEDRYPLEACKLNKSKKTQSTKTSPNHNKMKHDNISEVCVPTADTPGIYEQLTHTQA